MRGHENNIYSTRSHKIKSSQLLIIYTAYIVYANKERKREKTNQKFCQGSNAEDYYNNISTFKSIKQ